MAMGIPKTNSIRLSVFHGTMPTQMSFVNEDVEVIWEDVPQLVTRTAYSPSLFKERHRLNKNFLSADALVLDVDNGGLSNGGPSIEQAPEIFKGFRAIIAPTKNHQKEKRTKTEIKPACNRYRVIIPLSRSIDKSEDFRATRQRAFERWPFIDDCRDEARYYAPSRSIAHLLEGEPFPVFNAEEAQTVKRSSSESPTSGRPQDKGESGPFPESVIPGRGLPLFRETNQFISNPPRTGWRHALVKATLNAKQQEWNKDEWKRYVALAATNPEQELDLEDHATIDDIYAKRETHPPRPPQNSSYPNTLGAPPSGSLIPSDEETLAEIENDKHLSQMARDNPIELSFLHHAKYGAFNLPMGATLFGARSGRGKSATAANALADVARKYPQKSSLVLTNEETTEGVFNRAACAYLGKSFSMLQAGKLSKEDVEEVKSCIRDALLKRIKVRQRIATIEDAVAVFEAAVNHNPPFDLIIVDYLQNIRKSTVHTDWARWDVIKEFGDYLAEFGTRVITRVLIFAQLKRNSDSEDFQDRIQYDSTFLQHMKVGIEIIPNFDTFQTKFVIHKHRDGIWHVGAKAGAHFDESTFRYIPIKSGAEIPAKSDGVASNQVNQYTLERVGVQAMDSLMPTDQHSETPQSGDVPF